MINWILLVSKIWKIGARNYQFSWSRFFFISCQIFGCLMICQSTLLWKIIRYHAKMDENEENHSSTGLLRTHFIKALPNSSASVTHVIYTQLKNSIPVCNHWFRSVRKIDYLLYTLNYSTLKLKDELVGNWPIFVKGDGWWYKLFLPFVKKSCYSLEAALWGHNMASNKMTAHVTVLYE